MIQWKLLLVIFINEGKTRIFKWGIKIKHTKGEPNVRNKVCSLCLCSIVALHQWMSPVSLVFHTIVAWDWSQKCYLNKDTCAILLDIHVLIDRVKIQSNKDLSSILLHNKFGHWINITLTLASSFKNFLWEQAWFGIQLKDAV